MFVLCLMERLQGDWTGFKAWDAGGVCVRAFVWMSCSHAMIILCAVCTEQTVFAPSSVEQSEHCVRRAATVIMAIMSSPGQICSLFYGEKRSQTGREEKEKMEGEVNRVWWLYQKRSGNIKHSADRFGPVCILMQTFSIIHTYFPFQFSRL